MRAHELIDEALREGAETTARRLVEGKIPWEDVKAAASKFHSFEFDAGDDNLSWAFKSESDAHGFSRWLKSMGLSGVTPPDEIDTGRSGVWEVWIDEREAKSKIEQPRRR